MFTNEAKNNKNSLPYRQFCYIDIILIGSNLFMQQNQVIAELSEYEEGNPPDKENVSKTIEYLAGCRDLFEKGILSHEKIADEHSPVMQNMFNSYSFFVGWADYAWEQGEDFLIIII